nr:hypothetical protein [Limosilactobacillus mucosae]
MKILAKVFYALMIISMVSIVVGVVIMLWFNTLIGLKLVVTSFASMAICMLVAFSLDVYQ